jgi:CubicO group peptidase (beta-lactamase class C family)
MDRIRATGTVPVVSAFAVVALLANLATAAEQAINAKSLERLQQRAEETHSDAVVVMKDGRIVREWYLGKPRGPVYLSSAGKNIMALAIGRLIDMKRIESLDEPIFHFFPEWNQGKKKTITIRHLLNHTSGIENVPDAGAEIEKAPDIVKLALAAELSDSPGQRFSYNNKAVGLLSGIVERASGKRVDYFLRDELFWPLNIREIEWISDSTGTPYGFGGVSLSAVDFAKIGQLVVNEGSWNGEQIISQSFIHEMLQSGQSLYPLCGLLWWRLPAFSHFIIDDEQLKRLAAAKVSDSFLEKLRSLKGRSMASRSERDTALAQQFGPDWRTRVDQELGDKDLQVARREDGPIVGYYADGFLGNWLVVLPQQHIVAVRLVRRSDSYNWETDGFDDFLNLAMQLAD